MQTSGKYIAEEFVSDLDKVCTDCKSKDVVEDQGVLVCRDCGVIQEVIISEDVEWRNFDNDGASNSKSDPNRVGGVENSLLSDLDFTTTLEGGSQYAKLQNREALTTKQRNFFSALSKITELCSRLGLSRNVAELSSEFFKRVHDSDLNKGSRKTDAFIAACIFIACKKVNVARTIKELCEVSHLKRKHVGRCITKIKQAKLAKNTGKHKQKRAPIGTYLRNLERLGKSMGLSPRLQQAAVLAEKKRSQLCLAEGKQPDTVVSAIILLVVDTLEPSRDLTEDDCAKHATVSAGTIRTTYDLMKKHRDELIPPGSYSTI